jgi:hypothetical protein
MSVMARMRRDVVDMHIPIVGKSPYLDEHDGFQNSSKTLIFETLLPTGTVQIIVWDFSEPEVVRRISYNVGVKSEWVARGLPPDFSSLELEAEQIYGRPWGVRVKAKDSNGRIAIDQILQPRAHD